MPGALSWPFPWEFQSGPSGSRVIIVPGEGGQSLSYTVSGDDSLGIEAFSIDIDATAAGQAVFLDVTLTDPSGALLARVRSGAAITAGELGQCTFAPELVDSATFFTPTPLTQIQASLWDVEAEPSSVITVTALEAATLVTEARILCFDVAGPSGTITKPDVFASGLI